MKTKVTKNRMAVEKYVGFHRIHSASYKCLLLLAIYCSSERAEEKNENL